MPSWLREAYYSSKYYPSHDWVTPQQMRWSLSSLLTKEQRQEERYISYASNKKKEWASRGREAGVEYWEGKIAAAKKNIDQLLSHHREVWWGVED